MVVKVCPLPEVDLSFTASVAEATEELMPTEGSTGSGTGTDMHSLK